MHTFTCTNREWFYISKGYCTITIVSTCNYNRAAPLLVHCSSNFPFYGPIYFPGTDGLLFSVEHKCKLHAAWRIFVLVFHHLLRRTCVLAYSGKVQSTSEQLATVDIFLIGIITSSRIWLLLSLPFGDITNILM